MGISGSTPNSLQVLWTFNRYIGTRVSQLALAGWCTKQKHSSFRMTNAAPSLSTGEIVVHGRLPVAKANSSLSVDESSVVNSAANKCSRLPLITCSARLKVRLRSISDTVQQSC